MAFRNLPIAGVNLVRPAIQSPNFVTGSTGWSINRDGTSELNATIIRGSLAVGPSAGQHFIVNNPGTGDPLDVYNSSAQLVFSINPVGVAESHNPSNGLSSGLQNGQFEINDGAGRNNVSGVLVPAATTATQSIFELIMSPPVGTTYTLNLFGGSDDGSKAPTLVGNERNIQGSFLQSDQRSTNNLVHVGSYNVVTNASGHAIFPHGCSFTPKQAFVIGTAPGGTFANLTYGLCNLTSSQADVNWTIANTGAAWANSIITFNMLLCG